jgi:hypothetical protein
VLSEWAGDVISEEPERLADEEEIVRRNAKDDSLAAAALDQSVRDDEGRVPACNGNVSHRNQNAAPWSSAVGGVIQDERKKAEPKPKLRVHQPEPEPLRKVHAVFEDIVFDDDLMAKMMANMASHGMSAADIFG